MLYRLHDRALTNIFQAENEVVKTWGTPREEDGLHNHVDLVQLLDIADLEAGTSVAGTYICDKGFFA